MCVARTKLLFARHMASSSCPTDVSLLLLLIFLMHVPSRRVGKLAHNTRSHFGVYYLWWSTQCDAAAPIPRSNICALNASLVDRYVFIKFRIRRAGWHLGFQGSVETANQHCPSVWLTPEFHAAGAVASRILHVYVHLCSRWAHKDSSLYMCVSGLSLFLPPPLCIFVTGIETLPLKYPGVAYL